MIKNKQHIAGLQESVRIKSGINWLGVCLLGLLLLGPVYSGFAQKKKSKKQLEKTREQLEDERRRNIAKLEKTSKILQDTKKEKKASLGQLNALKQKEKIQKSLIRTINKEMKLIESEIGEDELLRDLLVEDLENLKKEYAKMVLEASKASDSYNKLMFLFSANSFYDLQMRLNYLAQYNRARSDQVEQITKVTETLNDHIVSLEAKKEEKKNLLQTKEIEQRNLLALENQKEKVVQELSVQEEKLKKDLDKQKQDIARLNKMIEEIIEEIKKEAGGTKGGEMPLTPAEQLIADNFAGNKGHHIWPVNYGFVTGKFGEHWHPTVPGVKIINIGIDIQTKQGAEVRCIYDGKVLAVANVPGMNKMVMVQHGNYFTVYTKVTNVFVKSGQDIKRKDPIGIAYTNSEGVTEMQFQVWKNSTKLDPEKWLAPLR